MLILLTGINIFADIKNRKWDYIVPGHGELIKIKEQLLLTKYWINYIDKTAKQAVLKWNKSS